MSASSPETTTLAGELFAEGVGAQAGPPTTPADPSGVTPGAKSSEARVAG